VGKDWNGQTGVVKTHGGLPGSIEELAKRTDKRRGRGEVKDGSGRGTRKGKEEYLYSTFLATMVHSKCSGMDHTVLPANNTMPAFTS